MSRDPMTAVDHAELKRLADALRVPWSDRGWTLASLLKEARQAADGLDALLSEIEGLKAERDGWIKWADEKICEAQAETLDALRTQAPDSWRSDREAVARIVDGLAFGVTNDPATDGRREAQRDTALAKADAILALRPQTAESGK